MSEQKTTEEFIKNAKKVHGNNFDYSEAIYKDNKTKLKIICKEHGFFMMTPNLHISGGSGCKDCSLIKMGAAGKNINNPIRRKRLEDNFISGSSETHSNKYGYSKVEYINAHTKVIIICPKHGDFFQTPRHHLGDGYGCNLCGTEASSNKLALTQEEFIKKAQKCHDNFYDYSKVEYINYQTKVKVGCPLHGIFEVTPSNHIHKTKPRGCKECGHIAASKKMQMPEEDFLLGCKRVHDGYYDYSKVKYTGVFNKIIIICPLHGDFSQIARVHFLGSGCQICGIEKVGESQRSNTKDFIIKAIKVHGDEYDYSNSKYGQNNIEKVEIVCKKHGVFKQAPGKHLSGDGCPKCFNKNEGRIAEYLLKTNIVYREFSIENKRYDFMLPDFNLIIERDGEQHYKLVTIFARGQKDYLNKQKKNDKLKTKLAKEAGFKISRIPYWLTKKEEEIEIENILAGKPTYPDVPDLKQEMTKPKPKSNL